MTMRDTEGKHNGEAEESAGDTNSTQYPEDAADKLIREMGEWIKPKIREAKITDWVLAFTSIALCVVGCGQYRITKQNNSDTSPLVGYAKDSTEASQDNADAAQQFADSAEEINSGVGKAVKTLNSQAQGTQSLVDVQERIYLASKATLRPVYLNLISIKPLPKVFFSVKNVGKTSIASVTDFKASIAIRSKRPCDTPEENTLPSGWGAELKPELSWGESFITGNVIPSKDVIDDKHSIYFWGEIAFDDPSNPHPPDKFPFCFYWDKKSIEGYGQDPYNTVGKTGAVKLTCPSVEDVCKKQKH